MKKYYIVYKVTNKINGKFYIGSHQTVNIEDGYLGSGKLVKLAIKKYGRENFNKCIICKCVDPKVMRQVETHFVRYHILKDKRKCYNRSFNGTGAMLGKDNAFFGKTHSDEFKEVLSQKAKLRVKDLNPFYGKRHKISTINKIKENRPNTDNCVNMLNYYLGLQKGWWCTPVGCFYSSGYAAKIYGVSKATIQSRCNNPDKIVKPNYQIPEKYHNKTWKDNGFYYVDKISGAD
ncbi:MAG: putative intron-associated endonuclease 1 [Prokaryotic dsDNA virus sp.]|jgi:group I intron endonuclease|nr:MAG: putative intron-associated endonuclease 1 [Prokaryotic dsDNA virus sp.]|tara:strand:- start:88039 stop:88737 length:699 start_codon:yes stop_codon:yes gene_type:complete